MSNGKEENQEQQQASEQPPDARQANDVNQGSGAKLVAGRKSTVRDAATADANSGQHAAPQHSRASDPRQSKIRLAKKRKKAAHRRRLRASSTNG